MSSAFKQFLQNVSLYDERPIIIRSVYLDMCDGDYHEAAILNQVVYWSGSDERGKPRLTIEHEGHLWLARQHGEWYEELRINARSAERIVQRLVDRGLLIKKVFLYGAKTTLHLRLHPENFMTALKAVREPIPQTAESMPNPQTADSPSRKLRIPYTEIYSIDKEYNSYELYSFEDASASSPKQDPKEKKAKAKKSNAQLIAIRCECGKTAEGFRKALREEGWHIGGKASNGEISALCPTCYPLAHPSKEAVHPFLVALISHVWGVKDSALQGVLFPQAAQLAHGQTGMQGLLELETLRQHLAYKGQLDFQALASDVARFASEVSIHRPLRSFAFIPSLWVQWRQSQEAASPPLPPLTRSIPDKNCPQCGGSGWVDTIQEGSPHPVSSWCSCRKEVSL